AGGVFSVVNPGTKAEKLAWLLEKYRATALVTARRLLTVACEAIPRAPSLPLPLLVGARDLPARLLGCDAARAAAPAAPPRGDPAERVHGRESGRKCARRGHRRRSRHDRHDLGLDRRAQGRDDDAPERGRRRDLHHDLSRELAGGPRALGAAARVRLRPVPGA